MTDEVESIVVEIEFKDGPTIVCRPTLEDHGDATIFMCVLTALEFIARQEVLEAEYPKPTKVPYLTIIK